LQIGTSVSALLPKFAVSEEMENAFYFSTQGYLLVIQCVTLFSALMPFLVCLQAGTVSQRIWKDLYFGNEL
jgi:hypothetical protein